MVAWRASQWGCLFKLVAVTSASVTGCWAVLVAANALFVVP